MFDSQVVSRIGSECQVARIRRRIRRTPGRIRTPSRFPVMPEHSGLSDSKICCAGRLIRLALRRSESVVRVAVKIKPALDETLYING